MKITINKKRAYLSFMLFWIIFMPPVLPNINSLYLVDLLAVVLLFAKYQPEYSILRRNRIIRKFNISIYAFSAVTVLHIFYDWVWGNRLESDEYIVDIYRLFCVCVLVIICAEYVVCYCIRNNINNRELCKCIVNAGLLQSIFTVVMILSPTAKSILNDIFVKNVFGSWEMSGIASWTISERLYGFANVLYDGFGYGTGIIAGIAFWLMFEGKFEVKKIIVFLLLSIVPTVNALTGFFIIIIGVLIKFVQVIRRASIKKTTFISILLLCVVGVGVIFVLRTYAPMAVNRLEANILAILGKNEGTTSFSNLTRDSYWTAPEGLLNKLIGTGHSVYTTTKFVHSDTGYTNMLWMVGILGCIWLYSTFVVPLYKNSKKTIYDFDKGIMLFLAATFMFFEIKGIGVALNTGIPIIIILLYMCAIDNQKIKNNTITG